jgi:hypothetical protein
MAKVNGNIFINRLSGQLGGQFIIKEGRGGRTIICKKPTFREDREFSPAQLARQQAFREAAAYARTQKLNPVYIEKAQGTAKCSYNVAIADWLHPPVIQRIERKNGMIRVQAYDNVMVTKVDVRVLNEDGELLEAGEANQVDSIWWEFPSIMEGTIEAIAWDLAGNKTKGIL